MGHGIRPPPDSGIATDYTIYPAVIGSIETESVKLPRKPSYDRLKTVLDPIFPEGWEHVSVLWDCKHLDMFVGEYSTVNEPRNLIATAIYRSNATTRALNEDFMSPDPESYPPVCGTAVLFHRRVWF